MPIETELALEQTQQGVGYEVLSDTKVFTMMMEILPEPTSNKLCGADNRPPMLEKDMYDSWKSRMELYMLNRPHGRMILESVEQGPLIWPSVEVEGVTRLKKYSELSAAEAIQADFDVKATNIILQGLPPEVYALVIRAEVQKLLKHSKQWLAIISDSNSVFILKESIPPKRKLDLSTGINFLWHGLLYDHAKAYDYFASQPVLSIFHKCTCQTMDTTIDQEVAMDEALVPNAHRLRIGRSNFRLLSDIASKESTLQLVTATVHYHSIWFKMNSKKHIINLESFREMLHICPRLPHQPFVEPSFEEDMLAFLWFLGHSGAIRRLTDVEHKDTKKSNEMYYPRNSNAYKECYAVATGATPPKPKASVRKTRSSSNTKITPLTAAAGPRLATSKKDKQAAKASKAKSLSALSEVAMTEAQQLNLATKRSLQQTHTSQASGSGADEGTSSIPGVPDVPTNESEEEISWNSTDEKGDDKDDDAQDDDDQEDEGNDEDDQEEGSDDEQASNEEEFIHPSLSTHAEEEIRDEDSFDPIPKTPENTDDEGNGQAENEEFLKTIDENMQKIIKEQVKEQVKTSNVVATDFSKMELKKILIEKIDIAMMMLIKMKNPPLDQTGGPRDVKKERSQSETATAEEPMQTTFKMEEPSHPEFETGADDQPIVEPSQHPEWFSQQKKPPTPDRDWNKTLPATHGSIQPWISELAKQSNSHSSFNELMDTLVDFSNFLMHRLKVDTLTPELLAGPTYELIKGSCKSMVELEFFLEEVYKATTDQLDWVNPEGASSQKYTTSVTKTKEADYRHIKWIEDLFYGFTVNWESARDVYSKRRIITVTEIKIVEWHNYKHLDWITVRRDDDKLYKFKEGDFKRLRIQDIEDMLLLLVQRKLTNLTVEECFAFNKKLNLTKPDTYRSDLKRKEAYIAYSNPRGFIYQNKDKQNRLMRIDELHEFSDGTLTDVRTALDDRLKGIRMKYLPQSIWRKSIQAIDKRLKTRRSLERFAGGRMYEGDYRMLQRTI
nr:hypothetical protein [Tanacetum cinerariifolium]